MLVALLSCRKPLVRTYGGKKCILCAAAATKTFRSGKYLEGYAPVVRLGLGFALRRQKKIKLILVGIIS